MPRYAALIYENRANEGHRHRSGLGQGHGRVHRLRRDRRCGRRDQGGGEALQPTTTATTVHVKGGAKGGEVVTTDGPFAETKEVLGGFYLLDCANLDEALKWAAQDSRRVARQGRSAPGDRLQLVDDR